MLKILEGINSVYTGQDRFKLQKVGPLSFEIKHDSLQEAYTNDRMRVHRYTLEVAVNYALPGNAGSVEKETAKRKVAHHFKSYIYGELYAELVEITALLFEVGSYEEDVETAKEQLMQLLEKLR